MNKNRDEEKIRVNFRKNRSSRTRNADLTRDVQRERFQEDETLREERIRGKGEIFRQRTVRVQRESSETEGEISPILRVAEDARPGVVLRVHGLNTLVEDEATGVLYRCAVRRLLKTLATSHRHVVVAGDRVLFRVTEWQPGLERNEVERNDRIESPKRFPFPGDRTEVGNHSPLLSGRSAHFVRSSPGCHISPQDADFRMETLSEGMIERIEPRHGCLCRTSRGRLHTLVANIDQAILVASAAAPNLKPNLIDRMLIMAEKMEIRPVVCINKSDLVDKTGLMPLVGVYARMGYEVIFTSVVTGEGISRLREILCRPGVHSVVTGQSGVGKSSLLNAVEEGLSLKIGAVSEENEKGRHTTSAAELIKLSGGGYVVDTPGIRQFELWDVIPAEVPGFFRDIRPYVSLCRFPDCTHAHEVDCAVLEAVEEGYINARRYLSFRQIMAGDTRKVWEEEMEE